MKVGSLFSGVGGFDLGFERAGMETAWFCEQDDYCRKVLARHWPGKPIYPDVCDLKGTEIEPVEVLCGGFPCQDLSYAPGQNAGLAGARSGLWSEFARLIGELRPRYVVVENVPALLARGAGTVLADLAALRYDAEWDCLPASAFGAPHRRDRFWLVAYPDDSGRKEQCGPVPMATELAASECGGELAGRSEQPFQRHSFPGQETGTHWEVEPGVGRVVDGFPGRVDRLRALGNALVPQIAEWIGSRIMAYEKCS